MLLEILAVVVLRVLLAAMAAVRHDDSHFGSRAQLAPEGLKGRWYMFLLFRTEVKWLVSREVRRWRRTRLCAECVDHILARVCVSEVEDVRWYLVSAVVQLGGSSRCERCRYW